MKKFLLFVTFSIFCFTTTFAQISVKSFRVLPMDLDARTYHPVIDQNGDKCALLKIVTTETGYEWDGGSLGITKVEKKTGEYWVYIPYGSRKITIKHDKLGVLRDYIYTEAISKATVYEMVLTTAKVVTTVVEREILSEWVIITSEPEGADIYIDDVNLGQTPFQQELKEGKHTFRISKDLYHTEAGAFQLSVDEGKKQLNYNLKPNFGYIKVNSQPESGATVFINGKEQNQKTPFKSNRLKSSNHAVSVSKQMYGTYETTVTVSDNQTTEINASLSARFGNLSVNSLPENGAEVTIDGQPSGKTTPCTINKLASGEHIISLRQQWYETKKVKITIADGENKTETITLLPTFAEVQITTNPNANIFIDNTQVGSGTYNGRLIAGLHTFEARKDKHRNDSKKLELLSGTTKEISLHPKPMYGTLKIVSTPFNADYVVKSELTDNYTGTTPNTIRKLLIGEYTAIISKTGYASETRFVNVKENETEEINVELSSGKQITINSSPQGASLYIDNNYKGTTPFTTELSFGKYNVKLSKAEYKELTQSIEIKQYTNDINLTLKSIVKEIPGMILVKGGTFKMGSKNGGSDEKPIHTVTVDDFYIGKYEVTNTQYIKFLNDVGVSSNGSKSRKEYIDMDDDDCAIGYRNGNFYFKGSKYAKDRNCPVIEVSWYGADAYCKWAGGRLPTEAEWEYAARGGVETIHESSQTKYAGSNNIGDVAWYDSNSGSKTHAVGTKRANELEIYDMSGNVWEWCSDWYDDGYYKNSSRNNPQGASSGKYRVLRGGSCSLNTLDCRVADRNWLSPDDTSSVGFRLVR